MDLVAHYRVMARNNRWSNNRLHVAMDALRPGEFEAPRTGFFPSLAATLNHILSVDRYYLDAMAERGLGLVIFERFVPCRDLASLARAQAEQDRALVDFCDELGPERIEHLVATDRGEEGFVPERVGNLLAHLFLHQIHHRGQVHAMLSGSSVSPPQLDEFLLDYDLPRRVREIESLGLD